MTLAIPSRLRKWARDWWPETAIIAGVVVLLAFVIAVSIAQDEGCRERGGVPLNGHSFHACLNPDALR